jgi:hypothetical protein
LKLLGGTLSESMASLYVLSESKKAAVAEAKATLAAANEKKE